MTAQSLLSGLDEISYRDRFLNFMDFKILTSLTLIAVLAGCASPAEPQALYVETPYVDVPSPYDPYGNERVGWAPKYFHDIHELVNSTGQAYGDDVPTSVQILIAHRDEVRALLATIEGRDKGLYGANMSVLSQRVLQASIAVDSAEMGCMLGAYETEQRGDNITVSYSPGCSEIAAAHSELDSAREAYGSEYERVFGEKQRELQAYLSRPVEPVAEPQPTGNETAPPANETQA